jgi:hypothetical protein
MAAESARPIVFDSRSGTLDDIYQFLSTLDCPHFQYSDVLYCYSELVGKSWSLEDGVPKRAPRIPPRSELVAPPLIVLESDSSPSTDSPESLEEADEQPEGPRSQSDSGGKWSDQENAALLHGIRKYGFGKWREIIDHSPLLSKTRTYRSVNARALRLKQSGELERLMAKGKW